MRVALLLVFCQTDVEAGVFLPGGAGDQCQGAVVPGVLHRDRRKVVPLD